MNEFKVLIFGYVNNNPNYVDENLLSKGIYSATVPALHATGVTIEKLIEIRKYVLQLEDDDEWCENIRRCRLIPVTLEIP